MVLASPDRVCNGCATVWPRFASVYRLRVESAAMDAQDRTSKAAHTLQAIDRAAADWGCEGDVAEFINLLAVRVQALERQLLHEVQPRLDADARVQELEQALATCQMIDDTFWAALKPLNLQEINVLNPGQHVTDLIARVQDLEREVARLTERGMTFSEMLDWVKLMPDSQVDQILAFVKTLREARAMGRGK